MKVSVRTMRFLISRKLFFGSVIGTGLQAVDCRLEATIGGWVVQVCAENNPEKLRFLAVGFW